MPFAASYLCKKGALAALLSSTAHPFALVELFEVI